MGNTKDQEILSLRGANVMLHDRILELESWGVPPYHRMCINCSRKFSKDTPRDFVCEMGNMPEGEPCVACTFDLTYMELVAELKKRDDLIRNLLDEREK
jgi:hypothetical protein